MTSRSVLEQLRGGLIVSCQAQESDPLFGDGLMTRMALAARQGGAVGIRANGAADVLSIKRSTGLPVIGIVKRHYDGSDVYITPTVAEVDEVVEAGADVVALDATNRPRANGLTAQRFIELVKRRHPQVLVMADISVFTEGVAAAVAGADLVGSTLSGYTPYSPQLSGPDFDLVAALAKVVYIPVILEGRVRYPHEAQRALELGCWSVVVGSAITRPQKIARSFAESMRQANVNDGAQLDREPAELQPSLREEEG
jgi:N-acylglucosamine-6-phosphate 2-epimerase